ELLASATRARAVPPLSRRRKRVVDRRCGLRLWWAAAARAAVPGGAPRRRRHLDRGHVAADWPRAARPRAGPAGLDLDLVGGGHGRNGAVRDRRRRAAGGSAARGGPRAPVRWRRAAGRAARVRAERAG